MPFMFEIQRTQIHYIKSFANLRRSRTPVQWPHFPERNGIEENKWQPRGKFKREISVIFQMSMRSVKNASFSKAAEMNYVVNHLVRRQGSFKEFQSFIYHETMTPRVFLETCDGQYWKTNYTVYYLT